MQKISVNNTDKLWTFFLGMDRSDIFSHIKKQLQQTVRVLPMLSLLLLSPTMSGGRVVKLWSHTVSGQQLRAKPSAEIMKWNIGFILLEPTVTMFIIYKCNKSSVYQISLSETAIGKQNTNFICHHSACSNLMPA